MKTEEIKEDARILEGKIKDLITDFVKKNGECEVKITSEAHIIDIAYGRKAYAGHNVNIEIVI